MNRADWLFLNSDGTKELASKDGSSPTPGDGHWHGGIGYTVRYVVSGRINEPNDLVIATENKASESR